MHDLLAATVFFIVGLCSAAVYSPHGWLYFMMLYVLTDDGTTLADLLRYSVLGLVFALCSDA